MGDKKHILFVDDEENILEGLRRMLRVMRNEWEMDFANDGEEALKMMAEHPFDVIVSDMRMPGIDGVQLLTEVKSLYPHMIRIVLSGHSDREMILRSVGPTHQYLSKPCDSEILKSTVVRACALRDLLHDPSLQQLVSQLDTLPSLPGLYQEIMAELISPDCSMQNVGKIIEKDVSMTLKILQIVNSAFFGMPRHVSSPAEAATLLGLDVIRSLVLTLQVFSSYDQKDVKHFQIDRLQNHSLTTAVYAKQIAKAEKLDDKQVDETFLAGLLHDIGRLILVSNLPGRYEKVIEKVSKDGLSSNEAEMEVFGTSHAAVGGYLVGLWGLPDPILEAIYFHHDPLDGPDSGFSCITAVHIANALDGSDIFSGETQKESVVNIEYLEKIGMLDRFPEWVKLCGGTAEKEENDE